ALELLPAADTTSRRLILARLIYQRAESGGRGADWPTALRTADLLGQFLDGLHRDDVPFSALESFSPEDMGEEVASHWKSSLEFLSILGSAWPEIMAAHGWMDPAARRTALMKSLGEGLEEDMAGHPIIVAGSLGTVRATSAFMAQVARNPNGVVVLPGLDPTLDDTAWEAIEAPHPQAIFRDWLHADLNELPRSEVVPWTEEKDQLQSRRQFLSLALRPANATDSWYEGFTHLKSSGDLEAACEGLSLQSADTPDEEASLIALLLREALETPHETAMLVTPDRDLARRVCAKLRAWNVDVDDTGGIPLGGTFRGTFLRAVAQWLTDPSSGVALMQLLNHELTAWGQSIDIARATARRIDGLLRGPKFPSWASLCRNIGALLEVKNPESLPLLELLSGHLESFEAASSLTEQLRRTIALGEALAATNDTPGADRLWRFEDGEELARVFDELLSSDYLPEAPDRERFAALLDALLGNATMRRRGVGHPRLFVYGLVEARLQTADLTVLAGLNEGVWPDAAPEDPFLSRQMRATLGLAVPEQEIGRAAHDFEQHAARPRVVISRSSRQGRSPATASRWWTRIESFLHAAGLLEEVDCTPMLRHYRALRERPADTKEIHAPAPKPPASARPRRLRVTDVGKLLRDPYAIYARLILGLKPMNQLDMEVGYAERGMV
ncbi:MAG: double-strand break repair protein AddB, partial [Pseudomonadota bacterium]